MLRQRPQEFDVFRQEPENTFDCSLIFSRSLNARTESRENWKSAQKGGLERVVSDASLREHFHQAFNVFMNAR